MFRKDVDFEAFERIMVEAHSGNPSASCRTVFGTHGSSRRPATEGEPSRERYQRVAACGSGVGNFGGYTRIDIQSPWVKLIASLFPSRKKGIMGTKTRHFIAAYGILALTILPLGSLLVLCPVPRAVGARRGLVHWVFPLVGVVAPLSSLRDRSAPRTKIA